MLELDPARYTLARPLFESIPLMRAVVFANLDGPQLGRVFFDQLPNPTAAFIWSDALYLTGAHDLVEFNQDFKHFVIAEVFSAKEHLLFFPFTAECFGLVMELLSIIALMLPNLVLLRCGATWRPFIPGVSATPYSTKACRSAAVSRYSWEGVMLRLLSPPRSLSAVGGLLSLPPAHLLENASYMA